MLAAILVLAAGLRVIAATKIPDQSQLLVDATAYRETAAEFVKSGVLLNWYQMPLYPLLIAITGPGVTQLVTDIGMSVFSVWLVYALADELFQDQYGPCWQLPARAVTRP